MIIECHLISKQKKSYSKNPMANAHTAANSLLGETMVVATHGEAGKSTIAFLDHREAPII